LTLNARIRRRARLLLLIVLAALVTGSRAEADTRLLVSQADATIVLDAATAAWTISTASIAVTLGLDSNQALVVRRVANPQTGRILIDAAAPDTRLTLNGQSLALAEGASGLRYEDADAETWHGGVHLAFTYRHQVLQTRVVRHYACYPGSPTIETWTTVQAIAGAEPLVVSHLVGWQLSVPAGTVRWINGLRGDAPDTPVDDAFSVARQDLAPGESLTLAAYNRSSERYMPFVMIDNGVDEWFGGVQWSGMWRITCTRDASTIQVTLEYPDVTTTVTDGRPLEMPHSFVGSVSGGPAAVSGALRGFLTTGVRLGRPLFPLVTYNTWFPYGARIDEPTMLDEIARTAALGVELFVLDAGWYVGAGTLAFNDFETGLGTWAVDQGRFPNRLRALADRAHALGMKFGLWVEPGRVSLDTVGVEGLAREEWLAQFDGVNVTSTSGKLCYGSRAAREWVRQKLFALIDDVQPDYLKWDNNAWVNCNRGGHDHGPGDGNFTQVQGLYAIFQAVRERYPDLLIENVANGGSRIDFGILRYSDAAWMDDRTTPSEHVRHNLEGLSALFPPGYLLSFVLDAPARPLAESSDPIADIRSGMFGILGFAYRSPGLRSWLSDLFAQAIANYRQFRDILKDADAVLLSEQAPAVNRSGWDALEAINASTGEAVLFAYQQADANDRVRLYPRGLRPGDIYAVRSLDAGDLGTSQGDALMEDGIEIVQGPGTQAHILILRLVR
jgi:hypothetical protein